MQERAVVKGSNIANLSEIPVNIYPSWCSDVEIAGLRVIKSSTSEGDKM
jgi:hypothetical protein